MNSVHLEAFGLQDSPAVDPEAEEEDETEEEERVLVYMSDKCQ